MIQAAPHAMSASQGRDYYDKEYSRGDYYLKDEAEVCGEWSGKGAEKLGLKGEVKKDDFTAVLEGKNGAEGKQIIPDPPRGEHRAGWDFTCSPDKSISVMALVGGDHKIVEDVKAANAKAMQELERFAMAKDKDRAFETTGNLVVASFVHETSRKLDPQLHIHNVVMNMTKRSDGKMIALETRELYAAQSFVTAVFRAELAERLKGRGYEIEVSKDGNVSIKDVPRDLCDEFSKRRREDIEPYLAKHGKSGAEAAQQAAHSTRRAKQHDIDETVLKESWREVAKEKGVELAQIMSRAEERSRIEPSQKSIQEPSKSENAKASLHHAMEHLSERKATFQGRELYTEALKHGMGKVTVEDIRTAEKTEKDLIRSRERNIPSERMTTAEALKLEQRNVNMMREGMGKGEAILGGKLFEANKPLSDGQKAVATHILSSKDQIIAVEGKAGAGKTYTLEAVVAAAKAEGWNVRGFAPTTSAAKTLGEAGLETKTIAALGKEKTVEAHGKQLWIVDEAGLMSSKAAATILERAKEADAKVVFVGDRLQHSAVEAGKPFAYLQEAGLKAVRLDDIQRQARPAEVIHRAADAARQGRWQDVLQSIDERKGKPIPELKMASQAIREGRHSEATEILEAKSAQARTLEKSVKEASEGRTAQAVAGLDKAGKVVEIQDKAERHRAVAKDYMSTPKGQTCIVVAPSNAERRDLNRLIREERIQSGSVEKQSVKAEIRTQAGLTQAQKKDARSYEAGDYLRFGNASKVYGIEKGSEGRVLSVDKDKNLVRVQLQDGKTAEFNPKRFQAEAYTLDTRRFSVGDRIQYREPTKADGAKVQADGFRIANGDLGTIKAIDRETGKAQVQMDSGKMVGLDLSKPQPIDHAYAITSHASQGMTLDRSLVVVDTKHSRELVNREQFYVSASRAALECRIYTDSKTDLPKAVSREAGKSSALEMVQGKATQEVKHATRPEPRRELDGGQVTVERQRDRSSELYRGGRIERIQEADKSRSVGSQGVSWNFDGGPAVRARNDLGSRTAVAKRDGITDRAVEQSPIGHEAISRPHGGIGRQEEAFDRRGTEPSRAANSGPQRTLQGEGGSGRFTQETQRGLYRGEGRGHEADRNRSQEPGPSPSRDESRERSYERDRQEIRTSDRGISQDRGKADSRDPQQPRQESSQDPRGLHDTSQGRHVGDWEPARGGHRSQDSSEVSREAEGRIKVLEAKLEQLEGTIQKTHRDYVEGRIDIQTLVSLETRQTEAHSRLTVEIYEAKQDARTDINQAKVQELKAELQGLEKGLREASAYHERAPLYEKLRAVESQIYVERHGQRTELGDLSSEHRLGCEEYKLHQSHRELSEFGKRHPETGISSPATFEAVQGMSKDQLQEFSKNLQQAAHHLQTVSVTLDRMKSGDIEAELKAQLKSAVEQSLAKAAPALSAASKAVEVAKDTGLYLSR